MLRNVLILFFGSLLVSASSWAAGYNVSGRILNPSGTPFAQDNVRFYLEVLDPAGTCVIYREQFNDVDMADSKGQFHLVLGSGTKLYPTGSNAVETYFSNKSVTFTCLSGATFTPTAAQDRNLRITFNDGTSDQIFSNQAMRWVPYATEAKNAVTAGTADNIGTYSPTQLLRAAPAAGTVPELSATQVTNLLNFSNTSTSAYLTSESDPSVKSFAKSNMPTCTTTQALTSTDGTSYVCKDVFPSSSVVLAGDVTGSYASTVVEKIQGVGVVSTAPTDGQVLKYYSVPGKWAPTTLATGVTSITAGTGISSGSTGAVTVGLANSGVTANTYGSSTTSPSITVDATGRITSASSVAIAFPVTSVNSKTGAVSLNFSDIGNQTATYMNYKPFGTACAADQILKYSTISNGWVCGTDSTSAGVTSVTSGNSYITVSNGTTTPTITFNPSSFVSSSGSVGGDLSGTYSSPSIAKLQGVAMDLSGGVQEGDTITYSSLSSKWILKRGGCEAGYTIVNKGATFCIKRLSTSGYNFTSTVNACGDEYADLCRPSQLASACRAGKMAATVAWADNVAAGANAVALTCTASSTYSTGVYAMSDQAAPYCCKPYQNY